MRNFEHGAFTERAAILEFDAGFSRFEAEVRAAQAQGVTRHDAIRMGDTKQTPDHGKAATRKPANDLPPVQPVSQEEKRPMPKRYVYG